MDVLTFYIILFGGIVAATGFGICTAVMLCPGESDLYSDSETDDDEYPTDLHSESETDDDEYPTDLHSESETDDDEYPTATAERVYELESVVIVNSD